MELARSHVAILAILFMATLLVPACEGEKMDEKARASQLLEGIPESVWKNLSGKKIYFGHRSVGTNLVNGIGDVLKENPGIQLNILETDDPKSFEAPLFGHSLIGENGNPRSKCDAFVKVMERGVGDRVDIAFFKFCFADIHADTAVKDVFQYYRSTMESLKQRYPRTTFIHVTVPLTVSKVTLKTWIKKTIGAQRIWEYDHNIKRNEFNGMVRGEYGGKEYIYDLEEAESTYPDGRRCSFTKEGQVYYSLVPEYTLDGSHLDQVGRRQAAEKLLKLLADLSK